MRPVCSRMTRIGSVDGMLLKSPNYDVQGSRKHAYKFEQALTAITYLPDEADVLTSFENSQALTSLCARLCSGPSSPPFANSYDPHQQHTMSKCESAHMRVVDVHLAQERMHDHCARSCFADKPISCLHIYGRSIQGVRVVCCSNNWETREYRKASSECPTVALLQATVKTKGHCSMTRELSPIKELCARKSVRDPSTNELKVGIDPELLQPNNVIVRL